MNKADIEKLTDSYLKRQDSKSSNSWRNDLIDQALKLKIQISEHTINELNQNKIKELENIVDIFLGKQGNKRFSVIFRNDLVEQIEKIDSIMPNQYIQDVFNEMIMELISYAKKFLLWKFSIYKNHPDKLEDIVNTAFAKFWKSFDGSEPRKTESKFRAKKPEHAYIREAVKSAQSDYYNKENPNEVIDLKDEERKPIKDGDGKQIKLEIPSTILEYKENAYDVSDENDEANTFSDSLLPESDDILSNERDYDAEENFDSENTDSSNDKFHPRKSVPPQINNSENKSREGLVKFGDKYFAPVAEKQIAKFYFLSGKADLARGRRTFLDMESDYKPIRKFVTDAVKPELENITASSIYNINRLRYLKFADHRQWMELAISELRKSKEKMIVDIKKMSASRRNFDSIKFKNKTPLLSAVVVDKNGNLVDTCFKGQLDQILKDRGDITWSKHCEYSLFTEVIKEENMRLIRGGVLYVTLEPCNKRKSYLDGRERKPKIPCSVRCVEAGLEKVYIGSYDYNRRVKTKGEEILKTGTYTFQLENGKHEGTKEEIRDALLLEEYFKEKKYDLTHTRNEIKYEIGDPVEVISFDSDLREEIFELNAWFLRYHEKEIYRTYE